MPVAKSRANATWHGNLMDGSGTVSTASGVVQNAPISWANRAQRTEATNGTSPEELIGAALASCFTMALSNNLASNGTPPDSLAVTATTSFETGASGASISAIHLDVKGSVPNVNSSDFQQLAEQAKNGCPVSQALSDSVNLTVRAELQH